MSDVKFGSYTIISSSEGGWDEPQIGFINNEWEFKQLAQADGELACELPRKGTEHRIKVSFYNVAVASVATIQTRIKTLRTQGVQTLQIPEFPDIPNCVVDKITPSNQRVAIAQTLTSNTAGKTLSYDIVFHQLFE